MVSVSSQKVRRQDHLDSGGNGSRLRSKQSWEILLKLVIIGVAGHSIVAGLLLLHFPIWTLGMVGWKYSGQIFWPSQAGLFLTLLGVVYACSVRWRPGVWFVIISKASAVIFLFLSVILLDAPRVVIMMGIGDGLMGLSVGFVFWMRTRTDHLA